MPEVHRVRDREFESLILRNMKIHSMFFEKEIVFSDYHHHARYNAFLADI